MSKIISFTLLYDKQVLPGFNGGWGLSLLIELANKIILFDTGWNGEILLSNISRAKIDLEKINHIVLSHFHWDHIGGIIYILNQNLKNLESIIVPQSFSNHFKQELSYNAQVVEIPKADHPIKLYPEVWSTGELGTTIPEQALILQMPSKDFFIVTGCAHPQIPKIISQSCKLGSIHGLIGGFHDFTELGQLSNLKVIVPLHCTKRRREILEQYPKRSVNLKVGEKLII